VDKGRSPSSKKRTADEAFAKDQANTGDAEQSVQGQQEEDDGGLDSEEEDARDEQNFQAIVRRQISPRTRKEYERKLARIQKRFPASRIEDIPVKQLQEYIYQESFQADGMPKSKSTADTYKNSLVFHYRELAAANPAARICMPAELNVALKGFVKGIANIIADKRRSGEYKPTEGRDALDFTMFTEFCEAAVVERRYFQGHLYFVLSWNLICRSDSTAHLAYSCIGWTQDCLRIQIPKSKALQQGANRGENHEFSVYANPFQPQICPLLALALHVLSQDTVPRTKLLFKEKSEQDRFATWFAAVWAGMDPMKTANVGPQSTRKGSISHALSFPGSCSAIAAILRGGWTLGGVMPKYVRQMLEGDETVGRLLCGLPAQTADVAILPPRWMPGRGAATYAVVANIVEDINNYPTQFRRVLPHLLASAVFHAEWIRKYLPLEHPIFQSRFWREKHYASLREFLLPPCHRYCSVTDMRATGVPAVAAVQCDMLEARAEDRVQREQMSDLMERVIASQKQREEETRQCKDSAVPPAMMELFATMHRTIEAQSVQMQAQSEQMQSITTQLTALATTGTVSGTAAASAPLPPRALALRSPQGCGGVTWPLVKLKRLHALWYEGDEQVPGGYANVSSKLVVKKDRKFITHARFMVKEVDALIPCGIDAYLKLSAHARGIMFEQILQHLVAKLRRCGHRDTPEQIMDALKNNLYHSLYENHFDCVRRVLK
jgi:hypothetical protein